MHPLVEPTQIQARQYAIRAIVTGLASDTFSSLSATVYDLERIAGRIQTGLAGPRDVLAWGKTLALVPRFVQMTESREGAPASKWLKEIGRRLQANWPRVEALCARILAEMREPAPLLARDGGIFKSGTTPDLDRLLDLATNGQRFLIELETRERQATGIGSLKVRYNRVFGYFIEVTQTHLEKVPAHYQRKQTTVGAERFFTEELKRFEDEILQADSRQKALEQSLFEALLREISAVTAEALAIGSALSELDAIQSLASFAGQPGWVFPEIDDSRDLKIVAGRHPVVEHAQTLAGGTFVPNTLDLRADGHHTLVITGPNMGGKSTLLRQTALVVILGQMGAPVPAASAHWGAVHSIHTRIGAHDAIARGQSTFMVEMAELAQILQTADDRSLIILDEIGRGTSTFDGISVAWAALEWLVRSIRGRTLFATHYHELTRLADTLSGLGNAHMGVDKSGDRIRFLFELQEGPANESFGVQVAELAGVPKAVVARAWEVLSDLEKTSSTESARHEAHHSSIPGLAVETAPPQQPPWIQELLAINLDRTTPLQALLFLANLKKKAQRPHAGAVETNLAEANLMEEGLCLKL